MKYRIGRFLVLSTSTVDGLMTAVIRDEYGNEVAVLDTPASGEEIMSAANRFLRAEYPQEFEDVV